MKKISLRQIIDNINYLVGKYDEEYLYLLYDFAKKSELFSKYTYLNRGMSTIVYKKNNDTVVCISMDIAKVSYLKQTLSNDFKFVSFTEYPIAENETSIAYIYEMPYLEWIMDDEFNNIIKEKGFHLTNLEFDNKKVISFFEKLNINLNFSKIEKIRNKYHATIDIHLAQFMKNKKGEYLCIDPLLSSYVNI